MPPKINTDGEKADNGHAKDILILCHLMAEVKEFKFDNSSYANIATILGLSGTKNVPRSINRILNPAGFELKSGKITARDAAPATPATPPTKTPMTPPSYKKRKADEAQVNQNGEPVKNTGPAPKSAEKKQCKSPNNVKKRKLSKEKVVVEEDEPVKAKKSEVGDVKSEEGLKMEDAPAKDKETDTIPITPEKDMNMDDAVAT